MFYVLLFDAELTNNRYTSVDVSRRQLNVMFGCAGNGLFLRGKGHRGEKYYSVLVEGVTVRVVPVSKVSKHYHAFNLGSGDALECIPDITANKRPRVFQMNHSKKNANCKQNLDVLEFVDDKNRRVWVICTEVIRDSEDAGPELLWNYEGSKDGAAAMLLAKTKGSRGNFPSREQVSKKVSRGKW